MNLNESKDLILYKTLLPILNDYVLHFPSTPVTQLLERCIADGLKVIPKDEKAQLILECTLISSKSIPTIVQNLLNSKVLE